MPDVQISKHRRELYERLAVLHSVENLTYTECARTLGVSVRTLKRWAQTSEYQAIAKELRDEWKEMAMSRLQHLQGEAITTLIDLKDNARSEHVRFEAAAKLGEWAGLGQEQHQEERDDREELEALYRIVEQQRQLAQVNIQLPPGTTIHTPERPQLPSEVVDGEVREV